MHDTAEYTDEKEIIDQKAIELAEDFSYDGYQVVRRELFAHLREPAVVIRRDSVTFNTACIAGLEDAVYIQILVNQDSKRMVVRKCEENDKDALRWCVAKPDKRKSRKMTNKIFSAMMYEMMGWNLDCRYKILGHKITFEDETIYVFDLMETEIFLDIKGKRAKKDTESQFTTEKANSIEETASNSTDNERSVEEIKRKNRIPFYPKEWKDSFGLPVEEHRKALEICYSIGIALGILIFFNHFGKKRFSVDPTPMEVEMRLYENDIQTTLIENYSRQGKEVNVDTTDIVSNHRT